MATTQIDVRDLPTRFAEAVSLANSGTEVIVTSGGTIRAKLIPMSAGSHRIAGLHAGAITTAADFDAPLADDFWAGAP